MRDLSRLETLATAADVDVQFDAKLSSCTTYRIGGEADALVTVHSYQMLNHVIRALMDIEMPWVVLGKGSNVLASDDGYRGCVIRLGREFSRMQVEGSLITAGAAVPLAKLVNETLTQRLSGLESCAGIPGTVGGAVSMDAGSRHEWIGRSVHDVVTYRPGVGMQRYERHQIEWGYRWCSIPGDEIILEASFELKPSTREAIANEMNRRMARRRATQPIGKPCCGSVFRNPPDRSVGALIEDCGLKGYTVGGASVSNMHANFVVNNGNATAIDVVQVMNHVHDEVKEHYGIDLTPEVKFLGFEG